MRLYESLFQLIDYFEDDKILMNVWLPESSQMTDIEFQNEVLIFKAYIEAYKPWALLGNTSRLFFTISTELQQWIDLVLFKTISDLKIRKYAILASTEFVAKMAIHQTVEQADQYNFISRYFDSEQKAFQWLTD